MNKLLLYAGLLLFIFGTEVQAQHYIGLNKEDAKVLARKSGFFIDNSTVNQKFNYLKFVNSAATKTLIVFFDEEDIASHTRMVCDYSEFDFVRKENDDLYKKVSKDIWEYKIDRVDYQVTLTEDEWYFVLRTKKK